MMRWTWLPPYTGWLFLATLLFNLRAAWKLAIDWAGMLTTDPVRPSRLRAARRAPDGGDPRRPPRRPGVPDAPGRLPGARDRGDAARAPGPPVPRRAGAVRRRHEGGGGRRAPPGDAGEHRSPLPAASSETCRPTTPSGSRTSSCPGPAARPSSSTGRSAPRRSPRSSRPTPPIRRGCSSACSTPTRSPTPTRSAGSPARSSRAGPPSPTRA